MGQELKGKSILVVDDDPNFLELIRELLEQYGCLVTTVRNTEEATASIAKDLPGLLIVDFHLPIENGLSWIAQIREAGCNTPIVLISASWLDNKTFEIARSLYKVALVLRKPIAPKLFINQLRNLIPAPARSTEAMEKTRASSKNLDAALDRLRSVYLAELPVTWNRLKETIEAASLSKNEPSLYAGALQISHRLRGSAGSLGLNIIGQVAGKIEDSLKAIIASPENDKSRWIQLLECLNEGDRYITEGLFNAMGNDRMNQNPTDATSQISKASGMPLSIDDSCSTISNKVLLLDPSMTENHLESKLCWDGCVEMIAVRNIRSAALNRLAPGSLDAAIISPSNKKELFDLATTIRSAPKTGTLPLALLLDKPADITPPDSIYAGISQASSDRSDEAMELLIKNLLTLSRKRKPIIMNVEDESAISQIIGNSLSDQGMLVHAIDEPIDSMNYIEEIGPDLVLLDAYMNGLSGYDVCRVIRQNERWHWLPIIFLSAADDPESRALAFEAGADDFISKPIVTQELVERVRHHLERPKRRIAHKQRNNWTGLLEPRSFIQQSQSESQRSIALIEIERFYEYSSEYGISATFSSLDVMERLITTRFPSETIRASWGEFGFALAFSSYEPGAVYESLKLLLEEYSQIDQGAKSQCAFKIGFASHSKDGQSLEDLLKAAKQRVLSAHASEANIVGQNSCPILSK